jgi:ATP-dependent DNA helicase RecG
MQIELGALSVSTLAGVGPSTAARLETLYITTVQDLLFHLPIRYQDRTRIYKIRDVIAGDHVLLEGEVLGGQVLFGKRRQLMCRLADDSGEVTLRFFHFSGRQKLQLTTPGVRLRCFGEIRDGFSRGLEIVHPEYRALDQAEALPLEARLTPIYPTTKGLQQATLRKLTAQALQLMDGETGLQELLPVSGVSAFQFAPLKVALQYVHRPPPDANTALLQAGEHPMQQRLAFEELVAHQVGLQRLRLQLRAARAPQLVTASAPHPLTEQLLAALPFALTQAQTRVLADIRADLASGSPMLRLVQGDVGSGKTIVAVMAMLEAVQAGFQAALMAPTEILVEQHARQLQDWLSPLGVTVGVILGQQTPQQRDTSLAQIASGAFQVVVGTHALFQASVQFSALALLVIDEQHRFGVHQRLALKQKGMRDKSMPHQLIMTATPIPRTLAMTAYADLDVSVIDALPPGRQPITTVLVSNERRDAVVERVRVNCQAGRQAYWVCTLIDESDTLQHQAAAATCAALQAALPELRVALVHGRLKSAEKASMMQAFKHGEIDLLVATTVIEVGVDVPNASVMIIENPERLGLAQLHQLRGRVGRGQAKSFCVLLYQGPLSPTAHQRLTVMRDTQDGFVIAAEDLNMRGPGDVLGTRQTGLLQLRVADVLRDQGLLSEVKKMSQTMVQHHAPAVDRLMRRWLQGVDAYIGV